MKLKDTFKDQTTMIFRVVNQDVENELDLEIEPTALDIIPNEEGYFIVRAFEVKGAKVSVCFMDLTTPERISEIVLKKGLLGNIKISDYYENEGVVIPAVASDCFGRYELYHSIENPNIGIELLKKGLEISGSKNVIAEDLGYLLRDENRIEEAIEAFSISEKFGPSSEYIYLELSSLYEKKGDLDKKVAYFKKFQDNGGKIIIIP